MQHIANIFSIISYVRASVGSWNAENAAAGMSEATKSASRVTSIMIDYASHCLTTLKSNKPPLSSSILNP